MPSTYLDSAIFRDIFTTPVMRQVWSDENRVQKYLDFEKALAVAQNAVAAYPNDPRALGAQARTQLVAGDHQQAIATLNRLAALLPQSPAPLMQLAEAHHANKDSSAAEQSLRRALAIQPDSAEIQRRLAALMLERGDRAGALGIASSMQRKQPQAAVGYMLEAEIQAQGGKWAEAVTAYRKTTDLFPEWLTLGLVLFAMELLFTHAMIRKAP